MDDDSEINIKVEFFFDDDMTSFALHLEADETIEVEELSEAIINFGRQVRSGEFRLYDPDDEVAVH